MNFVNTIEPSAQFECKYGSNSLVVGFQFLTASWTIRLQYFVTISASIFRRFVGIGYLKTSMAAFRPCQLWSYLHVCAPGDILSTCNLH